VTTNVGLLAAGFEEFAKFSPAGPGVSTAVPKTEFELLVSRNDTEPVGGTPPLPVTVAVSESLPAAPLNAKFVIVGEVPVATTTNANESERVFEKYHATLQGISVVL
jgi:hypothetical protein